MKKSLLKFTILILVLNLAACVTQQPATTSIVPVPADWAGRSMPDGMSVEAGRLIYTTYCQSCHGSKGIGDGPAGESLTPKPTDLTALAPQVGDDFLFWRISTGVEGTSMPAWGSILTEEEVWQIVAYIRTFK